MKSLGIVFLLFTASASANQCFVTKDMGCFADDNNKRILSHVAAFGTHPSSFPTMTRETCAQKCCADGFQGGDVLIGVEYAAQCFCGHGFAVSSPQKSNGCSMKCPGNSSETCGGSDAINIFTASCPSSKADVTCADPFAPTKPQFHGCTGPNASELAYCDVTKSDSERVDSMLSLLDLNDVITLVSPTRNPYCGVHANGIPKAGIPKYKWLTETNSCVASNGCAKVPPNSTSTGCPTVFVGPTGMAASWNRTSWQKKGEVLGREIRAFNNIGFGDIGLSGYGPNINMVKDPRYGRNSELAGEDPLLTGSYAVAMTGGMQPLGEGTGKLKGKKYQQMLAYVKHYTAYSVESSRFTFSANVTQFDFFDSFLPQYEMVFVDGNASGAMCSYFAPNGVSLCGNPWLLNGMLRSQRLDDVASGAISNLGPGLGFHRPDAVVMSDCSAVGNMMKNVMHLDKEGASAQAINAGLDVYGGWGDDLWGQGFLASAVAHNKTSEASVRRAVRRTLMQKMKVGVFDSPAVDQPWADLDAEVVGSAAHADINYDAALQSFVLLKNGAAAIASGAVADQGLSEPSLSPPVLPLTPGKQSIAVVGPMAMATTTLISDYEGGCPLAKDASKLPSIASAIAAANTGAQTSTAPGVDVDSSKTDGVAEALKLVSAADVTVLVLGITKSQEHEGMDRRDTLLPGQQIPFATQVLSAAHAKGKKVVLVSISGGIVSLESLAADADAIVDAFNPASLGPLALADLLFGKANRWGKLPVTIYPNNYTSAPGALPITSMSFATPPGRSYRYYEGTPTFAFGAGLSYTQFSVTCQLQHDSSFPLLVACEVKNVGERAGDEVVQVYHSVGDAIRTRVGKAHALPRKRLVAFERVAVPAGATQQLMMSIEARRCAVTNADGDYDLHTGKHSFLVETGVAGTEDIELTFNVAKSQKWVNLHHV